MLSAPLVHGAYRGGPSHLPGFSLVCDFKRGLYRRGVGRGRMVTSYQSLPGASYVRAGADLALLTPLGLRRFAANQPPIVPGYGLASPEATTNKWPGYSFPSSGAECQFSTGVTAATRTYVARADLPAPVLAALNRIDPTGIVPGLMKITADGTGTAILGIILPLGNVNPHSPSLFAYVTAGTWGLSLAQNNVGLGNGVLATPTGDFIRVQNPGLVPPSETNARLRTTTIADAGWEAYVFGIQVEEKGFVTQLCVTNGATASRGQPVAELLNLDSEFGDEFTLVVRGRFAAITASNPVSEVMTWVAESGSTSQFNLRRAGSAGAIAVGISGDTNINIPSIDPGNAPFAMAMRVNRATGASRLVTNGQARADVRSWPDPGKIYFGGNTSGTTPLRERVEFAGIIPRLVTDAELLALGTV